MQKSLERLIALLDLEEIDVNHYRGSSPNEGWQRVYGGQVLGQALVAASRTVAPERHAHSLHGYFLRPGDTSVPILYVVDRIRDGKSFTTRRVVAVQHGKAIFNMAISFQNDEDGLTHQFDMPDVPQPEDLEDETVVAQADGEEPAGGIPRHVRARTADRSAADRTVRLLQSGRNARRFRTVGCVRATRCPTISGCTNACSRTCRTGRCSIRR